MTIDDWIRRNRLIKPKLISNRTKEKSLLVKYVYRLMLNGKKSPASLVLYESHQADIRQLPKFNAIIFDLHFYDIAWLIASVYYSDNMEDIEQLANLLISDSLICHGNITLSLEYAQKYERGRHLSKPWLANMALRQTIDVSTRSQIAWVLGHEIAHFSTENDNRFFSFLSMRLRLNIYNQNMISEIVNSIDLSPIAKMLDPIAKKRIHTIKDYDLANREAINAFFKLQRIVSEYADLINVPKCNPSEKRILLYYACDNYIHNKKANLVPEEELRKEGICDLLSLISLFDVRVEGMNREESLKLSIESYALALLATDMIHIASIISQVSLENSGQNVDTIYMRRRIEMDIIPELLHAFEPDMPDISEWYRKVCNRFDTIIAHFCDYVFSVEYPYKPTIPLGTNDWQWLYSSINSLLQLPI